MNRGHILGDIRRLDDLTPAWCGAALTIGNFDGVHLGHRAIIRRCAELAGSAAAPVVAMTLDPHPTAILSPRNTPPILTPLDEKLALLHAAGADGVIVLRVDRRLLAVSAEDFLRDTLIQRMQPRWIVEGLDFGFGRGRRGNLATLQSMASDGGFHVETVEPVRLRGLDGNLLIVSSSAIRAALERGDVETADRCLGRPYALSGIVAHGHGVGAGIGFPTINLARIEQEIPADGVYAGRARLAGIVAPAAISIGFRDTFDGKQRVVEAFLLDAAGQWYDAPARLEFLLRLRDQQRFDSPAALTAQIARDVERVRDVLQHAQSEVPA